MFPNGADFEKCSITSLAHKCIHAVNARCLLNQTNLIKLINLLSSSAYLRPEMGMPDKGDLKMCSVGELLYLSIILLSPVKKF